MDVDEELSRLRELERATLTACSVCSDGKCLESVLDPEYMRTRIGEIHLSPSFWYTTAHGTFFFAIFLEMVISSGRSEPTVVIKLLPSPWEKKERAHGSFQRSWASCDNFFCRLGKNDSATLKLMERWALHDTTHACSHFTTTNSHLVLLVSLTP
jgi:hypothetical protein